MTPSMQVLLWAVGLLNAGMLLIQGVQWRQREKDRMESRENISEILKGMEGVSLGLASNTSDLRVMQQQLKMGEQMEAERLKSLWKDIELNAKGIEGNRRHIKEIIRDQHALKALVTECQARCRGLSRSKEAK